MQAIVRERRRRNLRELRSVAKGLLFTGPWLLRLLLFTVYPIVASLYFSFTRYDVVRPPRFIGIANYAEVLLRDMDFRTVLGNTMYFVLIGVPATVVVAFLLANLLNTELRFRPFFRTIFFIPAIVPSVASAMVWLWVYNTQYGVINSFLISRGLTAVPWLSSASLAKPSLILIQCWAQGTTIVIFLAALQDVPRSLYDAALVDGANRWHRFWNVTIPMSTPAILFALLMGLINTFQMFEMPWLLTGGGPNQATELYGIHLYRNAFVYFKMGYASSLAWILFVLIIVFSIAVFRSSARWVYYGGAAD